ncbi:hypothetical protein IQ249_21565 [Lusitaniella coriacea LEGE 07157]|uniref:Uncharacterized protein n=1 Tax=Lusitaniella coriacea LEGE 07157 TaxID=945747 RepID=A0A8J7IX43_9CYAN|nr:hypothetical protein [Lusitaniella coriacea]MBE9118483.1 hypothetical protein [Lusitaniella coriacea LEGE 07157]
MKDYPLWGFSGARSRHFVPTILPKSCCCFSKTQGRAIALRSAQGSTG